MQQAPDAVKQSLTDEKQQHYIEAWAWGPSLGPLYFGAMKAWREMIILLGAIIIGTIIPFLFFVPILASGYYVAMGRRIAWEHGNWQNFAEFQRMQRRWDLAAKLWLVGSIVLVVCLVAIGAWWLSSQLSSVNLDDIYKSLPYLQ